MDPAPIESITLDRISKTFRTRRAELRVLCNVNISIKAGEIIAFLGRSGCGKTTLLDIIAGDMEPSTGSVHINGASSRCRLGRIFQSESIFPWLTVEQNVAFGLKTAEGTSEDNAKTVQTLLGDVGLSSFASWWPRDLSGGMRRRVEIARAYAVKPKILLLDEPFLGLDELTREEMQVLLLSIQSAERSTILITTHDVEEAVFLSNRVVILGSQPSTIYDVVDVPLAAPRRPELKLTHEFIKLRAHILSRLKEAMRIGESE